MSDARTGKHPGIRGGHGSGRRGRPSRAEEIEAGVRCECGILVDRHPPLAPPLPWGHGRPCARDLTNVPGFGMSTRSWLRLSRS
jgi:hypothetical protein